MCRLQGEPGAQTDALIVCGLERCHAGLTEAEMERSTSVIALCPNFFPWHREPCCEKMKLFWFFHSLSFLSCENLTFLHSPGPPLGGVISPVPRLLGLFWAEMHTLFYILIQNTC